MTAMETVAETAWVTEVGGEGAVECFDRLKRASPNGGDFSGRMVLPTLGWEMRFVRSALIQESPIPLVWVSRSSQK